MLMITGRCTKMMRRFKILGGAVLLSAILLLCQMVQAQTTKRVLLAPFKLYSSDDLTYLQKGINQMLATRLTQEGKVEVVKPSPGETISDDPVQLARKTGADFLVTGSITLLGDAVSTDANVTDINQGKQVLTFSRVGKTQSDIIDHVDQLAAQMNAELFGRKPVVAAQQPNAPAVQPGAQQEPSIYQHPEKLLTQTEEGGGLRYGDLTGYVPAAPLVIRGRRVEFQIQGITTGDVDGDGSNEIVCVGSTMIIVYRIDNRQLVKMADFSSIGNFIGVDAVDVNENGKAEIFITNFDAGDSRVQSFVLEWDGKTLNRISQRLAWHFRAVKVPHRGKILAGQRQGLDAPFGSSIFEMKYEAGRYEPAQRLPLPRDLNIYGFAYGDVRHRHDTEVVAYNPGGFIQILDRRGDEEWRTSERYGGSPIFLDFPSKTDTDMRDYISISPRLHLYDLDEDGIQEIFVVKNDNIAGAFRNVRLFKNGRLEGLKWDELGLVPKWRTRNLSKYMADFNFADMDNDGRPEVVAAVVQKESGALSKGRSYVAVFKLVKPPKEKVSEN